MFLLCLLIELQEEEIKDKAVKIERAEQRLTTLSLEMKVRFLLLSLQTCSCIFLVARRSVNILVHGTVCTLACISYTCGKT